MAISKDWLETVERARSDKRWDEYDPAIQVEITAYNTRFASTPGYKTVNWLLVKAMVWTESGGPDNPAWKKRVLQIGNQGDPAYDVVRRGAEGSDLVMSDDLKTLLQKDDNIDKPDVNLRAGMAYLFARMALYDEQSISGVGAASRTYQVVAGDSLWKIAKKLKTTMANLQLNNPGVKPSSLRLGAVLRYQAAAMGRVIIGWRNFQTAVIADRYNGGGDAEYSAKLNHVMQNLFPSLDR